MPTDPTKQAVLLRIPRALALEVRRIAEREAESQSTIWRRLLREGLAVEHRNQDGAR
jgi:hypothetical protein